VKSHLFSSREALHVKVILNSKDYFGEIVGII
jgi:hypothetical protein